MKFWRVALFLFCFSAVISQPVLTARYYQWMLDHGAYRWDADSIAIPIGGNFVTWIFCAPVLAFVFWFAFWRLKSAPRLLAWDSAQKVKSSLTSFACFGCVYIVGAGIADALAWKNWMEVAYCIWWIVVWLIVRAAFLTPKEPTKASKPATPAATLPADAGIAPDGGAAHL